MPTLAKGDSLVVQSVTRRFGPRWVLRGVDAHFGSGELVVLEGENGAGKTTLLGILGGLVEPDSGSVVWWPDRCAASQSNRRVGWVGHECGCYRELTVRENVELVARIQGAPQRSVDESLERVGARGNSARRVGHLSRGQRQRVGLARAIVHKPDLLLLDEPFTGLDVSGADQLEFILREESSRGAVVIVVSHDPALATRLSARSVRLQRGQLFVPVS